MVGNRAVMAGLFVFLLFMPLMATTPGIRAQASYQLSYNLNYIGASPGSTSTMINLVRNAGTVAIRVTGITLTFDFGSFSATSGLPLTVPVGQSGTLNMTVLIPSSTTVGTHSASASIAFQYQDPSSSQWITPSLSPLAVQGSINVQNSGATPEGVLAAAATGLFIGAIGGLVVYLLRRRKKRAAATVPPSPQPVVPQPPGSS